MNTAIQRINLGHSDPQSLLRKLNQMVDAVNLLMSLRGDDTFVRINRSQNGGMTIGLDIQQVISRVIKGQAETFHARLTDSGTGTPKKYSWTLVKLDTSGAWVDVSPEVSQTSNALECNAADATSGTIVEMRMWGFDGDGKPVFVFAVGGGALPAGTRAGQVLRWTTDDGPWAAGFVTWTGVIDEP